MLCLNSGVAVGSLQIRKGPTKPPCEDNQIYFNGKCRVTNTEYIINEPTKHNFFWRKNSMWCKVSERDLQKQPPNIKNS